VTALLEVQDLNVWFATASGSEIHAVRGVSFFLNQGEQFGLVGESGCGKSTTILSLLGLLPSSATVSGRILLDGEDILARGEAGLKKHRWTDIAMVFQGAMNAFNPVLGIRSQIAKVIEVRMRVPARTARGNAKELLQMVGIPVDRIDRYPHEFSGGMRQRAAIALALACEPRILLADEPTTALDVMVQAQIIELLLALCRDRKLALVLVSHDLPLVGHVCERITVMYAGQIVESGRADTLFRTPAHPYTRLLFAATPDLFDEHELVSIAGAPPPLDRPVVGCPFRPRCDRAFDRCVNEPPLLVSVSSNQHLAACHLNDVRKPRAVVQA
jgi:peptide/nickel transport system ATP-binding protein